MTNILKRIIYITLNYILLEMLMFIYISQECLISIDGMQQNTELKFVQVNELTESSQAGVLETLIFKISRLSNTPESWTWTSKKPELGFVQIFLS